MQVKDCMKHKVFSIREDMTIAQAARVLAEKHIGSLPVVDASDRLVGLLPMRVLILTIMPDFINLVGDFDFVPDFGAAEERQPDPALLAKPVREAMLQPFSVEESSGLVRAFAMLHQNRIHDLPVVNEEGKLVGILSRVDAGAALLRSWNVTQGG